MSLTSTGKAIIVNNPIDILSFFKFENNNLLSLISLWTNFLFLDLPFSMLFAFVSHTAWFLVQNLSILKTTQSIQSFDYIALFLSKLLWIRGWWTTRIKNNDGFIQVHWFDLALSRGSIRLSNNNLSKLQMLLSSANFNSKKTVRYLVAIVKYILHYLVHKIAFEHLLNLIDPDV